MKRFLMLGLLLASTARADDRASAERYFRAGSQAYAAQNFSAAAADFDEAYKAMPLPEIAFSAAQAYRRLFRVDANPDYARRCVELYKLYLERVKTGGRVGDAADSLGEMEREMERANIKPTAAAAAVVELGVSITTPQGQGDTTLREVGDATSDVTQGLQATLDGKPIEPFTLVDVEPRGHVVGVTAAGYFAAEKRAVAVAGQSQLIELELRPKPATVAVHTEADAVVALDGRPMPGTSLEIAAGKHLLTVTHRGREPFGAELVLQRGQALVVEAPLRLTARRKAVPWVLGAGGVLAVGALTTTIFAIVRDHSASRLQRELAMGNQTATTADDYDQTVTSRDHFVTATWILGGAAVATAATGLALYLFDAPSAEAVGLAPLVAPGAGGAVWTGRF
jgi:hypothetical protein